MRITNWFLALLFAAALSAPVSAQDVHPLRIPFNPAPATSFAYRITETANISWNGAVQPADSWSHKFEIIFGGRTLGGMSATIAISDVTGEADSLRYLLAKAAEGEKFKVIVDTGGFVREIADWPGFKAQLSARVAEIANPATAKRTAALLDRLDPIRGSVILGRTLLLVSSAYPAVFASDKSRGTLKNWQGGSAYIIPGRTITTQLVDVDGEKAVIRVAWSLATDTLQAARLIGPEFISMIAPATSKRGGAEAMAEIRKALAEGRLSLAENAEGSFDLRSGLARSFRHEIAITVRGYRSNQTVTMELLDE